MSLPHTLGPNPSKAKYDRKLYHSQAQRLPKMILEKESFDYKTNSVERAFNP